jgi:enoyl-CoA hydratase
VSSLVLYEVKNRKAYLTLNRPDRLNAITAEVARELKARVDQANADPDVHVIVLQGAGRAFSAGYDMKEYAEEGVDTQAEVWDPIRDFALM